MFDLELSESELDLMCRPASMCGLGINDPIKNATYQFQVSKHATQILSNAIISGSELNLNAHNVLRKDTLKLKMENRKILYSEAVNIVSQFSVDKQRTLQRKLEAKSSGRLTVIPTADNSFEMSAAEFRDSISLRYGRTPAKMPGTCDADGQLFDVNHALNCPRGGLVYGRHNEARDLNCDLLEMAGLKQVTKEPVIIESDSSGENGLRADWGARGFWEPQLCR